MDGGSTRSVVLNHIPGGPPTLDTGHLIQVICSLVETHRLEMDQGDMQNVQCWGSSRNVVENHCTRPIDRPVIVVTEGEYALMCSYISPYNV